MNKRLSRHGFNVIAKEFNTLLHTDFQYKTAQAVFDEMVDLCCDMFEADNPQFDRDRFFTAVYQQKG